jgi:hypothetical protein
VANPPGYPAALSAALILSEEASFFYPEQILNRYGKTGLERLRGGNESTGFARQKLLHKRISSQDGLLL